MFSITPITAENLPEKTLCLTFDDGPGETIGKGPGPKTLELARYLYAEKITACFFMTGIHLVQYPDIAQQVSDLGHIIGNHSFTHAKSFPEFLKSGWDIVSEIEMTDNLIKKFNPDQTIYFRAPWGDWSADVAKELNNKINNRLNHIGPFHWEIGPNDWSFWLRGDSSENCAAYYMNEIRSKNRGIVLMHDSTTDLVKAKENNLTFESVKILVPKLKDLGYSFVSLKKIAV
jgi:peptidoglycan/xylan/chitin deacetylase (PgdA/CDA1 family)